VSTSLTNTVALLADAGFRERVKAAMTETAVTVASETAGTFPVRSARISLAMAVVYDADSYVPPFARLCADDAVISAVTVPADVPDAELRRVVGVLWSSVAASVPNLPH
jgi:hypothetical protein